MKSAAVYLLLLLTALPGYSGLRNSAKFYREHPRERTIQRD